MPIFPALGMNVDADTFEAIIEPTVITHDLPYDGQNPWGDTFRLWAGDIEVTIMALQSLVEGMFGPGIERIEYVSRTAYDLLSPPVATTLYAINEAL